MRGILGPRITRAQRANHHIMRILFQRFLFFLQISVDVLHDVQHGGHERVQLTAREVRSIDGQHVVMIVLDHLEADHAEIVFRPTIFITLFIQTPLFLLPYSSA